MKTKGNIYLKIAGVLEILMGVATISATLYLLSLDPTEYSELGNINVNDTLISLVWIYASSGFQILAGIIGFMFANKENKANVCKIFGFLLIVAHFAALGTGGISGEMGTQVSQYVSLVIPCIYVYGSFLNGKK